MRMQVQVWCLGSLVLDRHINFSHSIDLMKLNDYWNIQANQIFVGKLKQK